MKKLRKIMFMVIVFVLCITAVPVEAQAASSKNKKAHKAYQKQRKNIVAEKKSSNMHIRI